jgi:hypothetical protein
MWGAGDAASIQQLQMMMLNASMAGMSQLGQSGTATLGGPDATRVLLSQLRREQARVEELQRAVDERDRLILQQQLAEMERERRDAALRLRMLEGMAAFRRREGVLKAERESIAAHAQYY